jgi:hypothetical protein
LVTFPADGATAPESSPSVWEVEDHVLMQTQQIYAQTAEVDAYDTTVLYRGLTGVPDLYI